MGAVLLGPPMRVQAATQPVEVVTPIPNHLVIGDQIFEANVTGLRAYIDSIQVTQPQLYAQLAPDVEGLESERTSARAAMVIGAVTGLALGIYGFAFRPDCQEPSLNDPNFAAKSDAWGACNEQNIKTMALFSFLGLGTISAGALAAWALGPSRSEVLDVVNKHNRLSPEPLHLQLGYDPSRQFAFAGATLAF
jgi:hypothetical protein